MTIERERLPLILRTRSDEDLHRLASCTTTTSPHHGITTSSTPNR